VYASVISFAQRARKELRRLDGFIANAGIEPINFQLFEGCESTLTVNVLSTFLLAILMLPKLKDTSITHAIPTNLSFVGSMQQIFADPKSLESTSPSQEGLFEALSRDENTDLLARYALSKLIVQLCARELAEQVSGQVVVNCVNPGWCDTGLSTQKGLIAGMIFRFIGRSAENGGRTLVHAVTAGRETNGKYLSECQVKNESEFARSSGGKMARQRLWKELEDKLESISSGVMRIID
jgi:retinol dehydrogenase-12